MTGVVDQLRHNRISLALHTLADGSGLPLLLLHGLGERSPEAVPANVAAWDGPVLALDFTGHGESSRAPGGGYTAEVLMGDADCALAHIGPATVVGRGLGAYVALLLAGARPRLTRGVILADGPGLHGGPAGPLNVPLAARADRSGTGPDPFALLELSVDPRPPEYALTYAGHAAHGPDLPDPIAIVASARPPWLAAVAEQMMIERTTLQAALMRYGQPEG